MHYAPAPTTPDHHKTRRLVVVSNRTASGGQGRAGGLAVALAEAVRERGGLWFGWSGTLSDTISAPRLVRDGGIDFALTDLTPAEHEGYYFGYANRVLWPLFHYRTDLAQADGAAFETYEAVNRRFARQLAPLLRPDDIVWVHDYHLIPLARELRAAGWRGTTGFFLHIPFPAPEVFSALPQHARLARTLADYDLVGFQTEQDAGNFRGYLARRRGALTAARVAEAPRREPRIGVFPIGIDPGEIDALLRTRSARETEA
ncbi:MAG TPA: trehalose-6-phosphate synthase, partial [Paracoccaceae bacterium]|nr:trehalose-6-phosphate synthase [Paracoccaceae bacterium]